MKKSKPTEKNMTASLKNTGCRKAKEAKASHNANEDWQRVEATEKYRRAIARDAGWNTTDRIAGEMLDGIFLSFNTRNGKKSASEQKRLLRRIVEKRQAQAIHAKTRKSRGRKASIAVIVNSSKCMQRLHNLRFAC